MRKRVDVLVIKSAKAHDVNLNGTVCPEVTHFKPGQVYNVDESVSNYLIRIEAAEIAELVEESDGDDQGNKEDDFGTANFDDGSDDESSLNDGDDQGNIGNEDNLDSGESPDDESSDDQFNDNKEDSEA